MLAGAPSRCKKKNKSLLLQCYRASLGFVRVLKSEFHDAKFSALRSMCSAKMWAWRELVSRTGCRVSLMDKVLFRRFEARAYLVERVDTTVNSMGFSEVKAQSRQVS